MLHGYAGLHHGCMVYCVPASSSHVLRTAPEKQLAHKE
jgi:hypothetical protein